MGKWEAFFPLGDKFAVFETVSIDLEGDERRGLREGTEMRPLVLLLCLKVLYLTDYVGLYVPRYVVASGPCPGLGFTHPAPTGPFEDSVRDSFSS